jgi:hypothetical protein
VRRLLLLGVALVLLGLVLASAAMLEVDGGVLQSFRLEVVIDVPEPTTSIRAITDTTQPST